MKDYSVLNDLHTCQWAQLVTAYDKGFADGQKHDLEHTENIIRCHEKCKSVLEAEYERGVNDLWESVCKFMDADIVSDKEIWGCTSWEKFAQLSPSEVIERLKEYNKKQEHIIRCCKNCKHSENGMVGSTERCESCYYDGVSKANTLFEPMETDNSKIEVGDEIYNDDRNEKAVVHRIDSYDRYQCLNEIGAQFILEKEFMMNNWTKTGRHFPQIAEVLEQMRGRSDA